MVALILNSVVPVRVSPQEQAEQSTQILFGETADILETTEDCSWVRLKSHLDGESGWVSKNAIIPLKEEEALSIVNANRQSRVCSPCALAIDIDTQATIHLTIGTRLPDYKDGQFKILGGTFRIAQESVQEEDRELTADNLVSVVRWLMNVPYQWGGKSVMGMDCSGFVQIVLSLFGKGLPRNASQQVKEGKEVAWEHRQIGDLLFFDHHSKDPTKTNISHVGILIAKDMVIHCSGNVHIDKLTEEGIWDAYANRTHDLVAIRRM